MSLSFIELFLFTVLGLGVFLCITLQLIPNKNKAANKVLTWLIVIASIMLFGRIAIYQFSFIHLWRLATIIDVTLFLFGPFLYCYIRRLAFREKKLFKLSVYHFIPMMIYLIYFFWTLTMSIEKFNTIYFNGTLNIAFLLTEFIGLLSLFFYIIKSYKLLIIFKRNQAKAISYNQAVTRYIKLILTSLSIFTSIWLLTFINFYLFNNYSSIINYNSMWLSSSIFMYLIGFYSLTQPNIFRVPLKIESKQIGKKYALKNEELKIIEQGLKHKIEKEKIFLKPDLNLNFLAKQINTSSNNLSWYLNNILHKSFYEYINSKRIDEFLKLIEKNEHETKTIFSVSLDAGFNSKSTFNNAFKTIMKDTPKNYINNLDNLS